MINIINYKDYKLDKLEQLIGSRHLPNYYTLLLDNHKEIIKAVTETTQAKVATRLNLTTPQFSAIYNLLLAYSLKD